MEPGGFHEDVLPLDGASGFEASSLNASTYMLALTPERDVAKSHTFSKVLCQLWLNVHEIGHGIVDGLHPCFRLDFYRGSKAVCAEVDLNLELFEARNDFLFAEDGVGEGRVERFREDILAVAREVDEDCFARRDGPCDFSQYGDGRELR
jgi:hypothetical protein